MNRPTNEVLGRLAFLANTRGIIPDPINATRVWAYNTVSGANNAVVYTVPAGTKLFIDSAYLGSACGANAGFGFLSVWNSVPAQTTFLLIIPTPIANIFGTVTNQYFRALEVPPGYTIRVECNAAGMVGYGIITGWLESV